MNSTKTYSGLVHVKRIPLRGAYTKDGFYYGSLATGEILYDIWDDDLIDCEQVRVSCREEALEIAREKYPFAKIYGLPSPLATLEKDIKELLISIKNGTDWKNLKREWQHANVDFDGSNPNVTITFGVDLESLDWGYQTGDNSYSGAAYHYKEWFVTHLMSRSNCNELAKELINEICERMTS